MSGMSLDAWTTLLLLAFTHRKRDSGEDRYGCCLCKFTLDVGEREAEITKKSPEKLGNSLMITHLRVAHRSVFHGMLERVYNMTYRGIDPLPAYSDAQDDDTVNLLAPDVVNTQSKTRRVVCCLCNYTLYYRNRRHDSVDEEVRDQMNSHLLICHEEEYLRAREVARESHEVRAR